MTSFTMTIYASLCYMCIVSFYSILYFCFITKVMVHSLGKATYLRPFKSASPVGYNTYESDILFSGFEIQQFQVVL